MAGTAVSTPREIDALLGGHMGAHAEMANAQAEKADATLELAMAFCGGNTWCNKVVDKRQLANFPAMTLFVARACKIALVFFICVCTLGLMTGFLFQGSLELLEEVNQMDELAAPRLALCAQPWGTKFAEPPAGMTVNMITIPTGKTVPVSNYTTVTCPAAAKGCYCTDFSSVVMKPRGGVKPKKKKAGTKEEGVMGEMEGAMGDMEGAMGEDPALAKRGELTSWEYLRVSFKATNTQPHMQQFAFGFYDSNLPQQWTYANLGSTAEGDIKYEEVAHGKTEFTDGTPVTRYSFRLSGESVSADGDTVLLFGYDRFLAYVIASVGSKWSLFSVMTLLITFCAAINNFGLFEIFFPEKLDEDDPAQLVPSPALSASCGMCCICCNPRAEKASSDIESKGE